MEVDRLAPGDPFHYHPGAEGYRVLSPTYESSAQITPLQIPQRPTVSATRYSQYLENASKVPRTPWGTGRERGEGRTLGLHECHEPKAKYPTVVVKGHKHFGYGGYPLPSDVTIDQYYDLTQLKRSQLRPTDQLLPAAGEFAMDQKQIRLPFPAEHPFHSHVSKFTVFPNFTSPDDPYTGVRAGHLQPINPDIPAKNYDVIVTQKTKGFPFRHEKQEIPTEAEGLQWPGQEGYFQYPKSAAGRKPTFYPTPPKGIAPNITQRSIEHVVSERTANILKTIEKSLWLSTHKRDFTGNGPMNPIQLDDYFDKKMTKLTGKYSYFTELKEQSHPTSLPNPPLRPPQEKESSNEGCADDDSDYQCADASPTLASVPACEAVDVKSQPPTCEANSASPTAGTSPTANEANLINWSNTDGQTTAPPNIFCPYSDIQMLRYKVEQKGNNEKPSAFYQHQKERVMDCWKTPVIDVSPICRKGDFEELRERPKSVKNDIIYADLPQSRLLNYTPKENHIALNKPPSANGAVDDEDEVQCFNKGNRASGDFQPTCCSIENEEFYRILQQPRVAWGKTLICDEPKPRVSKLKFPLPFDKTQQHKKLHQVSPEKSMDYRENIYSGRKHTFFGLNSSYFHSGTL
ncbi:sperm-associated microtubule inner protein 4 [Mobula birostris]|uniref:sperm-associated microtubule inner protein 4 n=1 Tax=Mobula birostris TaxID=1983395 RepID=UPI003B2832AE